MDMNRLPSPTEVENRAIAIEKMMEVLARGGERAEAHREKMAGFEERADEDMRNIRREMAKWKMVNKATAVEPGKKVEIVAVKIRTSKDRESDDGLEDGGGEDERSGNAADDDGCASEGSTSEDGSARDSASGCKSDGGADDWSTQDECACVEVQDGDDVGEGGGVA
jgi:hypothetical protein